MARAPRDRLEEELLTTLRRQLVSVGETDDAVELVGQTLEHLRELLSAEQTLAYAVAPSGRDRHCIEWLDGRGAHTPLWAAELPPFVGASPSPRFGLYDCSRPEPEQRNRVLAWTGPEVEALARDGTSRVAAEIYPRTQAAWRAQARLLLCDGPSLLAWVGAFREEPFDEGELRALRVVGSAMRRRLRLERRFARDRARSTLDAVLDGVGGVVFVVASDGKVLEANRAAREHLERAKAATSAELADAVRDGRHPRWSVSPLALRAGPPCFLVTTRAEHPDGMRARIDAATKAWALTARQRQVLEKVAEGNPNRTISAMLGIAERTVELHLTAIFEKAQVESRAELVAVLHAKF